jgi:hypothetical protein
MAWGFLELSGGAEGEPDAGKLGATKDHEGSLAHPLL